MLLTLLLQSSWPTLHPVLLLVLGALLTALATWLWKLRDERRTARLAAVATETEWRKARTDAESALGERITNLFNQQRDALKAETQARVQWQLENDADIARIAEILKDVNETNKLMAALAATSKHHDGELTRISGRVETIGEQLTQFIMDHAKH